MTKRKTESEIMGDAWRGLLGKNYAAQIPILINYALENGKANYLTDTIAVIELPINDIKVAFLFREINEEMLFISMLPKFYNDNNDIGIFRFKVSEVNKWENGLEAVFDGELFAQQWFCFYCQNYYDYIDLSSFFSPLKGKEILIEPTIICLDGELIPDNERILDIDAGLFKGEKIYMDEFRGIIPRTDVALQMCEFGFPIVDIEEINFMNEKILKIKGVVTDQIIETDYQLDYNYYVYSHISNIKNPEKLKIGEPFRGFGWMQAEVIDFFYDCSE